MSSTTRRTSDPPRTAIPFSDRAVAHSRDAANISPELPAVSPSQTPPPRHTSAPLLTMRSTAHTHDDLLAALSGQAFDVQPLERWEHLLAACERFQAEESHPGGAVLIDLDEAERSPSLRSLGISAHRLTHLLARELARVRAALVVVTTRDYAELEDLIRAGVHALLHPATDPEWRAEQVREAVMRRAVCMAAVERCAFEQRDVVQRPPAAVPGHEPDGKLVPVLADLPESVSHAVKVAP